MLNCEMRSCLFDDLFEKFLSMFQLRMICWYIDVANNDVVCTICKGNNDYVMARINYIPFSYGTSYFDFADFFRKIIEHYQLDWKLWVKFLQKRGLV